MGLRIVGRQQKPTALPLTEDERHRQLEHTVEDWLLARGGDAPQDARAEFMAHFCRVKARLKGPSEADTMLQMAHQLRASIKGGSCGGIASHSKVDVATLLVLL